MLGCIYCFTMKRPVTRTYLEMRSPAMLRPATKRTEGFRVERVSEPCPELNRFFYTAIGGDWYWIDKLPWNYAQWSAYVNRTALQTWIGYLAGNPVGYFELLHEGDEVEIAYFGLLPQFTGRGLGGLMLTAAIEQAWALKPARVLVDTCTLDGPAALQNYQARGFRIYHTETDERDLPDAPPGPWPHAR
jgi:GNAT superfamily N-acetyltransferase